ncbi:hypothetical protein N7509_012905 [Penicillium cosmopolitanum]|uniref:Uncharacterized protein n=1 Tax=Penicillium cosmopolitanum TaxID=1131564 RepID=A0A9W9SEA1_9EURO|nr:uncharacterized protein N7509_012905 [Penicillium cosmopolitanum]KAJ5376019.1 hypothetical protein N7509_012905 [Penicillium cosmopolitanum]
MNTSSPLFVAQEAVCFYPISTIYDSCPRYLFYALLAVSILTRWTGWLSDVFLGAAATYAGTASIQSFILVSSPQKFQQLSDVTIPYVAENTTLQQSFPQIVTGTNILSISPGALELDGDAVLAIVVTGYLVFLPLMCWSRYFSGHQRARALLFCLWNLLMLAGGICALVYSKQKSKTPTQYMFCYPDLPPFDETSSDGWQASWRTSSWNESVWGTFSNISRWNELGDLCFNPCFNSSQILRQPTSLESWVATRDSELDNPNKFINRVIYSKRYIYSLVGLSVILNFVHLTFKWLPYRSNIPSAQIIVIWRERRKMWNSFKGDLRDALSKSTNELSLEKGMERPSGKAASIWSKVRPALTICFIKASIRVTFDCLILFGLVFSMIISPFTTIAFIVWIEWWIHNDGPGGSNQESEQQVGQWSYLVGIALLMISAAILALKYRIASACELETEISSTRKHLAKLERMREARSPVEIAPLARDDAHP